MNKNQLLILFLFLITAHSKHLRTSDDWINSSEKGIVDEGNSLGSSIAGFIIGPILLIISLILIWNNQKTTAIDHRRMRLVKASLKQVDCQNYEQIMRANGQLVHVTGNTSCQQTIVDEESGISLKNTIKLKRNVEVLQTRVISDSQNNQSQQMWVTNNQVYPGSGFTNDPAHWFINTNEIKLNTVNIGHYILSESLKNKLAYQKQYTPSIHHAYNIANRHRQRVRYEPIIDNQYMYFPISPGNIYLPGTLRVKYTYCQTGTTSLISQSSNTTFSPFRIDIYENGKPDASQQQDRNWCFISNCTARLLAPMNELDVISQKIQSSQQMLKNVSNHLNCGNVLIRFISYFVMAMAFCVFLSPITTLLGYVPFIGGSLSSSVGTAIFISALIISIPLFLLVISICWLIAHPKVGLILFGFALLAFGIVVAITLVNNNQDKTEIEQQIQHHSISLRSF